MRFMPRKRWQRILVYLGASLLAAVLLDQIWVRWDRHITPGHNTTRITAPMIRGYPDYLADLNARLSEGVTPENNAAPLLFQVTGLDGKGFTDISTPEFKLALSQRLGIIEPSPAQITTYTDWALQHWTEFPTRPATTRADSDPQPNTPAAFDDELTAITHAPWSTTQHPLATQWLKSCEPALLIVEQACQRPRFYAPLATDKGELSLAADIGVMKVHMPWLSGFRGLGRTLIARAMFRLGSGDEPGFERDVLSAIRLSRLTDQHASLIEHFVAMSIDALATEATQQVAASQRLNASQADSLRQAMHAVGPLGNSARSFDLMERYSALDAVCTSSRRGAAGNRAITGSDLPASGLAWSSVYPINYNALLREFNGYYDRLIDAYTLPTYADQHNAIAAVENQINHRAAASVTDLFLHPESVLVALLGPRVDRVLVLDTACQVDWDLAQTSLVLRATRAQTGKFPDRLEDLQHPDFAPPMDRFTDLPLVYRRQADGYILYSVGENIQDDGGLPRTKATAAQRNQHKWDMVVQAP